METLNALQSKFIIDMVENIKKGNHGAYLLQAPAGTGKTFVSKFLIDNCNLYCDKKRTKPSWKNCQCFNKAFMIAPTHKAKKMLVKNGCKATTIHRFLNASHEYDILGNSYFDFAPKEINGHIIFIDECSMLTDEMYDILIEKYSEKNYIIFCGDDLQLPPIKPVQAVLTFDDTNISDDALDTPFKLSKSFDTVNKFVLTVNMRSINELSTVVIKNCRNSVERGRLPVGVPLTSLDNAISVFRDADLKGSSIILAYSNASVNFYNKSVRTALYGEDPDEFCLNETLIFTGIYQKDEHVYTTSDTIVINEIDTEEQCLQYHRCKCMIENTTLIKCEKCGIAGVHCKSLTYETWVFKDGNGVIWKKPKGKENLTIFNKLKMLYLKHAKFVRKPDIWKEYFGWLNEYNADLRYSYSCTIHKSQGDEWNNVFVDRANIETCIRVNNNLKIRAYYTAVSRMKNTVCDLQSSRTQDVEVDLSVVDIIRFGKLEGQPYVNVLKDPKYCQWILERPRPNGPLLQLRQYILSRM